MSSPMNINGNSFVGSPSKVSSSPTSKSSLDIGKNKTISKAQIKTILLQKSMSGNNLIHQRLPRGSSPVNTPPLHSDDDNHYPPDSPKASGLKNSTNSDLNRSGGSVGSYSNGMNGHHPMNGKISNGAGSAGSNINQQSQQPTIDRSLWTIRALKDHPEIVDIIDRVKPINRGIALAQSYLTEETLLNNDRLIGQDTMLQLILQHLQFEGLLQSRKQLEEEAKMQYSDFPFTESRLMTILRTAIKDSEKIYSLTLDEHKESQQQLEEHLALMGLLRDETIETTEDVNIYDEPEESNIIYVEEKDVEKEKNNNNNIAGNNNNSSDSLKSSISLTSSTSGLGGSGSSLMTSVGGGSSSTLNSSLGFSMGTARGVVEESKILKAASLNKLVNLLTPERNHDLEFSKTFLLTYQSFTTPEKLFQKLVQRYHVNIERLQKMGLNEAQIKNQVSVIQIRVANTLKTWIKEYFSDFNDKLIQLVKSFCETLRHDNNKPLADRVSETLNNKIKNVDDDDEEKKKAVFTVSAPEPKVPKNIWSQTLDIFDIDEEEIARQLTLIDFEIFSAIKPTELLNQSWNKPKLRHRSPNVLALINRFNEISQWTASSILSYSRVKDRARIMSKFVKIAEYAAKLLNNFNVAMAILSGLNAASVHRLKFTKEEMANHTQKAYADLSTQFSNAFAYREYRNLLAKANPPCLPYLGVHLTDLTFVEEGNPDMIQGLINFSKRRLVYQTISIVHRLQNSKYNLQPVYQIAKLLRILKPRMDEDELYLRSMKFEPRNKERNEIL